MTRSLHPPVYVESDSSDSEIEYGHTPIESDNFSSEEYSDTEKTSIGKALKSSKGSNELYCAKCNYKYANVRNFNKHMKSAKHANRIELDEKIPSCPKIRLVRMG